jgi:SLT domain-containing protein/uncharacterized coiled-coil protein SlyX
MATKGRPLGNLIVNVGADGTNFSKDISAINRQLKTATTAMKAHVAAMKNTGNTTETLKAKFDTLNNVLSIQQKRTDALRAQYQKLEEQNKQNSAAGQKLARQINESVAAEQKWERQIKESQVALKEYSLGIEETKKKLDQSKHSMDANVSSLEASGKKYSAQKAKIDGLSKTLALQNQLVDKQKQKLNELTSTLGANDVKTQEAANEYQRLVSEQKKMESELDQLKRNFQSIPPSLGGFSDKMGELSVNMNNFANKTRETGNRIKEMGSSITQSVGVATAGLGAGLGLATKKAMDFEAQMSSVKSVMAPDEVKKYGGELEKLAIIMGSKTKYSATESATAIEELVKAGVSVRDIIHGGLEGALNLATAGELELKDAAEIASTALNAFRDDNISVARAADILAGAANASATDVQELKFGLSAVSAVASGVGLSFEDTATALAVFAQNGLKGQDAGTSLKTMLLNLSPSTKSAAEMMDSLGLATKNLSAAYNWLVDRGIKPASHSSKDISAALMKLAKIQAGAGASATKVKKEYQELAKNSGYASSAFYDQNGKLKSLSEIAGLLHDRLKNLTEEQRQYALKVMFGTDAIRAGNILYKEGAKGINEMNAAMNKIKASDVAKQKLDNLKGTVEQLNGSLETAGISIGTAMLPALRLLTQVIQSVVDKFNSLPKGLQQFLAISAGIAVAVGAIVTALGFAAIAIGGFINGMSKIAEAVANIGKVGEEASFLSRVLTILTGPVGIALAVISALGIAFVVAYNKIKPFHDFVNKLGISIKNVFISMRNTVSPVFSFISGSVKKGMSYVTQSIGSGLKSVLSWWKSVFPQLKTVLSVVFAAIKVVIGTVLMPAFLLIRTALGALSNSWKNIWHTMASILKLAFDNFKTTVKVGWVLISGVFKIFLDLLTGKWKKAWTDLKSMVMNIMRDLWSGLKRTGWDIVSVFVNLGKSIANGLLGGLAGGVNGIIDGIDWVLRKVGAKKYQLPHWKVPHYAKGTDNHQGGLAVVSDGAGKNKQELITLPDGRMFLSPKQETVMNLPKGTSVLNGNATAELLKMLPKYADGVGWLQNAWDTVKSFGKKSIEVVKDVWSYASNPKKLLTLAINKFTDLSSLSGPVLHIVKGTMSMVADKATDWIKQFFFADNPPGSGVQRWRPYVIRALEMNGLSTSESMIQKVLRQIQTESGGNPRAVQHGYTDINTIRGDLAKGLMQTISSTFNAYKFPGHDDIFNGFDNLLAALNYAKHRYGKNLTGLGEGHGYSNGGIVVREQLAHIAEGNKPEAIIPLTKRSRAMQLLAQVAEYLGVGGDITVTGDNSDVTKLQSQQLAVLQEQVSVLKQILKVVSILIQNVGKESYIGDVLLSVDGQKFAKAVVTYIKSELDTLDKKKNRYGGILK